MTNKDEFDLAQWEAQMRRNPRPAVVLACVVAFAACLAALVLIVIVGGVR